MAGIITAGDERGVTIAADGTEPIYPEQAGAGAGRGDPSARSTSGANGDGASRFKKLAVSAAAGRGRNRPGRRSRRPRRSFRQSRARASMDRQLRPSAIAMAEMVFRGADEAQPGWCGELERVKGIEPSS